MIKVCRKCENDFEDERNAKDCVACRKKKKRTKYRICMYCPKHLTKPNQKYCARCRDYGTRQAVKRNKLYKEKYGYKSRLCKWCNTPFTAFRKDNIYCSRACGKSVYKSKGAKRRLNGTCKLCTCTTKYFSYKVCNNCAKGKKTGNALWHSLKD